MYSLITSDLLRNNERRAKGTIQSGEHFPKLETVDLPTPASPKKTFATTEPSQESRMKPFALSRISDFSMKSPFEIELSLIS